MQTELFYREHRWGAYTSQTRVQKRFTISEVATGWHDLTIPQRTMRPSTACVSEQLDSRCSRQTYHRPTSHTMHI